MLIRNPASWSLPERAATEERHFLNRRQLIAGIAAAAVTPVSGAEAQIFGSSRAEDSDPSVGLYPAERNQGFEGGGTLTPERLSSKYNNFYEFGGTKRISNAAQKLRIRPWEILIDGEVEQPLRIDIDDLLKRVSLEERVYRHRCVETWSMIVPWSGFPLYELLNIAAPLSSAKFIRMETFEDSSMAPRQRQFWRPWPYVEGLTIEEAENDLAFLVTGAYGKPLAKQFGAPLRLAVPWKYGFKSIKSIVRFEFTSKKPVSFWETLQPKEYGFWANVNPEVPHPRWSQAMEQRLGEEERIATEIFNGYGEDVAHLYPQTKIRTYFF